VKVGDNTKIGANSVVVTEVPSNSIVVGIPGKVVFRVEGEKRIQMDTGFMPDPQSRAIASLLERVRMLEERIMKDEERGTRSEGRGTRSED
jgi:serine O-acetyltransferase